jgi:feruloyl esterase
MPPWSGKSSAIQQSIPFIMRPQTLGLIASTVPFLVDAKECSQATFENVIPPNSTFNYVTKVAAGGSFGDAYASGNATGLPEGCAVGVRVPTPGDSSYNMAIYLPNKWNSRIMTTGNGGYAANTNWKDIGVYSQYGFATLTTVSIPNPSVWPNADLQSGHWTCRPQRHRFDVRP